MDTKFSDDVLYSLEREYGVTLTLRDWETNANSETGVKVQSRKQTQVRAIKLPSRQFREFFYDVGYLRANSNFTYGGVESFDECYVIVRKSRCKVLVPTINRDALLQGKRYDTIEISDIEAAWVIKLKNADKSNLNAIVTLTAEDHLRLEEGGA